MCYTIGMKLPIPPTIPASIDPAPWDIYWAEVKRFEKHKENAKYSNYRKQYYAKKTEQRQIAKLKELVAKYPDHARQFVSEDLQ